MHAVKAIAVNLVKGLIIKVSIAQLVRKLGERPAEKPALRQLALENSQSDPESPLLTCVTDTRKGLGLRSARFATSELDKVLAPVLL